MTPASPPRSRLETPLALGAGILVAAGALALGGVSPEVQAWTGVAVGGLLALRCLSGRLVFGALEASVAVFLAYAYWRAAGNAQGLRDVGIWIQGFALFLVVRSLDSRGSHLASTGLWFAAGLGVIVSFYQLHVRPGWLVNGSEQAVQYLGRASGTFGNPNHFAAFLLLVLPLVWTEAVDSGRRQWQRGLAFLFALAVGLALLASGSRSGWVGGLVMACYVAARSGRRKGWFLAAGIVAGGAAALVCGAGERWFKVLEQGGEPARRILWAGAWTLWEESPWLGQGGGGFATAFERVRPAGFHDLPGWAHSEVLGGLAEFGVLGLVLALVPLVLWFRLVPRASLAKAGLLGFGAACVFDFQLHIPGLVWASCLAAGLASSGASSAARPASPPAAGVVAGCLACLLALMFPSFHSEGLRRSAAQRAGAGEKRTVLLGALAWDAANARAWADLSRLEVLEAVGSAKPERARVLADLSTVYARCALGVDDRVAEFWIHLGDSLEVQGRTAEAGEAFSEALKRAPARADVWYRLAYHLGLKPQTQRLALTAVERCLQLDPGMAEAQALAHRLSSVE